MKSKLTAVVLGAALFLSAPVFAREAKEGCSGGQHHLQTRCQGGNSCPIGGKTVMKLHFILENKGDLKLTEDQIKTLKELKLQSEKDGIRQNADSRLFMLDLKSKLEEDKIDVEGANTLIDKGFSSMATAAKSNLEAYAKLNNVLTDDQRAKIKELWKEKFKGEKISSTTKG